MTIAPTSDSTAFQFVAPQVKATCTPRLPVYFFLDFSNIAIAARDIATTYSDTLLESLQLRLHAGHFRELAERDRLWRQGFAAAGLDGRTGALQGHFDRVGIEFQAFERGCSSGREQGIDDIIQGRMYRLLSPGTERGVVVLATGDGNGHYRGEGFLPVLQALNQSGFRIEVMSWKHSFNAALHDWVAANGQAIVLDPHFCQLTFIQGGRRADRVRHRLPK